MSDDNFENIVSEGNRGKRLYVADTSDPNDPRDIRFEISNPDSTCRLVHAREFEAHIGRPLHYQDVGPKSTFNIMVKGGRGDYAPPGILQHTFKEETLGQKLNLARRTMADVRAPFKHLTPESQGLMRDGKGDLVYSKSGQPKHVRELSGDDRWYDTPGGRRERNYDYGPQVTAEAAGERMPDITFELTDNQMFGIYRTEGDEYSGDTIQQIKAKVKEKVGQSVRNVYVRSQSGIAQNVDNLERDGKSVQKRLDSYLRDVDYGKDLPELMINYGNDYWSAKKVLALKPDGDHAKRLKLGPEAEAPNGYDHKLSVVVKDGARIVPVEYYSRNKSEDFRRIVEDVEEHVKTATATEVKLYSGSWDYHKDFEDITESTQTQPQIFVEVGKGENTRLAPIQDVSTGDIDKSFPPRKRYAAKVGPKGFPTGVYENMEVMDRRDVSQSVKDTLREVGSKQMPSRVKPEPERGETRIKVEPGSQRRAPFAGTNNRPKLDDRGSRDGDTVMRG